MFEIPTTDTDYGNFRATEGSYGLGHPLDGIPPTLAGEHITFDTRDHALYQHGCQVGDEIDRANIEGIQNMNLVQEVTVVADRYRAENPDQKDITNSDGWLLGVFLATYDKRKEAQKGEEA